MVTKAYGRIFAKVLSNADTDTLAYTVPTGHAAVFSSINIVNTTTSTQTFRLAICPGAIASVALEDYLYYDQTLAPKTTFTRTCGDDAAAASQVLVRASSTGMIFNATGIDITL